MSSQGQFSIVVDSCTSVLVFGPFWDLKSSRNNLLFKNVVCLNYGFVSLQYEINISGNQMSSRPINVSGDELLIFITSILPVMSALEF